MKINDLDPVERSHYYNDSDVFNAEPPKTPERFKYKKYLPITALKSSNYKTISNDNIPIQTFNNERYYNNKKDHINDCLRSNTPFPYFKTKYDRYKTTQNLKNASKKLQLDKSYEYNFEDNNNIYKSITFQGKKGNLYLGNDPTNFSSEYNSMQDYARRIMLKKRINKEKLLSDKLNKSVDISDRFMPLKRKNYNKKNAMKEMYIKNTIDVDLNKSTDNINLNRRNNIKRNNINFNYYKSNIFFDKEKEKTNEELDKIENENKILKHKEKLRNLEIEKEKFYHPNVKKRKNNFLYDDLNKIKKGDAEEYKKFNRDGNFPLQYSNYKPKKEFKLKSLDDEYNAKNRRLYYGLTEMERNTDKFVVLDISKNDKFDSLEIKNLFSKNGIHMFGEQTFNSYIENGKKGKFVFNIRKDLKDKDYNAKLKKVQNILMKKQGIVFNLDNRKINYNKKIRNDITPTFVPFRGLKANRYKGNKSDIF